MKKKYQVTEENIKALTEAVFLDPDVFLAASILVKTGKDIPAQMKKEGYGELPVSVEDLDVVNQIGMYAAFGLQVYLLENTDPVLVTEADRRKVQKFLDECEQDIPWFSDFEKEIGELMEEPDNINEGSSDFVDALYKLGWCVSLGLITSMDIDPKTTSVRTIMDQLEAEVKDSGEKKAEKMN